MKKASSANDSSRQRIIGKRNIRVDSRDKVTGRAIYTDDIHLPGTLFGRLKRSSIAHGFVKNVNVDKAAALPGVRAIITGRDLPVRYGILPVSQDEHALAIDKVRYIGDPVAAVCADSELIAEEAAELIEVEYEPLEPILSVADAFKTDLRIHDSPKFEGNANRVISLEFGDVSEAFAACDHAREDTFYYAGSTHVPMETHSTVADFDGDRVTLYVSHQAPYYLSHILPKVLDIPPNALRVIVPYVGGGFGGKLDPFPDTICAAKLSMIAGKPVKFTLSREEVFYNHRGRHASLMWMKTGVRNGKIAAMHFKGFLDGGAYSSFGTAAAYYHGALQPVTYKIPNYKVEIARFYTNKPACGPKRGHGTPQPRFALECHLDKIAEDIGVDPHALRSQNLIEPFSKTVNHLRVTTCALGECMQKVVDGSRFFERRGKLPHGRGIGLAVGAYLSGAALPIYWNDMPHSEVLIKASRTGTITVYSGHTEIGQGADTVLAYIVAEGLGVEPEDVALILRDSDSVPPDLGSYSSRVTVMMGNAACQAVDKLKSVLAAASAEALGEDADQIVFANRRLSSRHSPDKSISLEEAIAKAEARHGALSFSGSYKPEVEYGDFKGGGVGPSPAYSYAACVIDVSVDVDTGFVRPQKVWLAHDIGKCINRRSVEGQIEGGVYMGLGEAMMEEMVHTKTGHLKNAGLLDYKTLTVGEMPPIEIYIVEDPDAGGPYGAKEVGQGPLLPVLPAFSNAVYDAIGVRFDELPITPDKVLKAMEGGEKRVGPSRIIDFPFPPPIRVEEGSSAAT